MIRRIHRFGLALILALVLKQGLAAEPPGELSLRQALALTLARNSELAAFLHEVRANEAAVLQADMPPNPVLELGAENLANKRLREDGDRTLSLGFGQLIELGASGQRVYAWPKAVGRSPVGTMR